MKDLDNGAYRNELYVAHYSELYPSYSPQTTHTESRCSWRRQCCTIDNLESTFVLVKQASSGVGAAFHQRAGRHDRGHRNSIRTQVRERIRQVRHNAG